MYGIVGNWAAVLLTKVGDLYIAAVQVLGAVIGKS